MEKMQPGCLIQFPGKPPILKKGKVDPIKLDVEQRGSKKKVWTIRKGMQEAVGSNHAPSHISETHSVFLEGVSNFSKANLVLWSYRERVGDCLSKSFFLLVNQGFSALQQARLFVLFFRLV